MHKKLIIASVCSVNLNFLLLFLLIFNNQNPSNDEIFIKRIKTDQYEIENLTFEYKSGTRMLEMKSMGRGTDEHQTDNFWNSKLTPAIISTLISATVTITIFLVSRRIAKNQLNFDIAFKHLLPKVYMELIRELNNQKFKGSNIDFSKIEKVILENQALIIFTPKNIQKILLELLRVCQTITNGESYNHHEGQIIRLLSELEREIIKRFGAFVK
ncbi:MULTISPECIES: hypothetical protein [Bacillus]|uniref:hypothetical protein n=1 Tax=Bacillus TaxID=1386 RepID=UPI0020CEDE4B|nr:hypothetical protein [Bacillus safensis]MCP9283060.1 hypothetical protein [Bacillus safensis]MED0864141.1 hypothetical protein [Bacillus safensis]